MMMTPFEVVGHVARGAIPSPMDVILGRDPRAIHKSKGFVGPVAPGGQGGQGPGMYMLDYGAKEFSDNQQTLAEFEMMSARNGSMGSSRGLSAWANRLRKEGSGRLALFLMKPSSCLTPISVMF